MLSTKNEKDSSMGLILVVDDNEINRYVANKLLTQWGYEVVLAENGQMAVDQVLTRSYDMVLMDVHMPVMDGLKATAVIRSVNDGQFSELPIVALTASIFERDLDEIRRSGMTDYIAKPFVPESLRQKISEILSSHYSNSEL